MTKGIASGTSHSYTTFGFRMRNPQHPKPNQKIYTIDIPYRDGAIDLSDVMGQRYYERREISFEFWKRCQSLSDAISNERTFTNWLMSLTSITDDSMGGAVFEGLHVSSLDSHIVGKRTVTVSVTFSANPKYTLSGVSYL